MAITAERFSNELMPCNWANLELSAFISGET